MNHQNQLTNPRQHIEQIAAGAFISADETQFAEARGVLFQLTQIRHAFKRSRRRFPTEYQSPKHGMELTRFARRLPKFVVLRK
jgi:hypothetical protein